MRPGHLDVDAALARHGLTASRDMPEVKRAVLSRSVVSDSLQPCGLHPTRLLRPWDSPGEKTGVGCHALLQGDLPDPGMEPRSPALQADSLLSEPPGLFYLQVFCKYFLQQLPACVILNSHYYSPLSFAD